MYKEWIREHNEYGESVERPFPYALVLDAKCHSKLGCLTGKKTPKLLNIILHFY